jgi:hypothetical protein
MEVEKGNPAVGAAGTPQGESPYKNCTIQRVENQAENGAAQQINAKL